MRWYNTIIESKLEPENKYDLWIKDKKLKIFLNGVWEDLVGESLETNEEDLSINDSGKLELSNRNYNPEVSSGKGYKILRKYIPNNVNILNQEMINEENTIYEIRYDFDLNNQEIIESVKRILSLSFYNENASPSRKDYGGKAIVEYNDKNNQYILNSEIQYSLKKNKDFRQLWIDGIRTGLSRSQRYDSDKLFTIGEKYTRKDVMRQSNNITNVTAQNIGGYYFNDKYGMIFVTYKKSMNISKSIQYEDRFLSDRILHYYSKNNRKLTSKEVQKFFTDKYRLLLFMKKSDADDNKDFYYLGTCSYIDSSARQENQDGKPIVSMNLRLDNRVNYHLYHLLTD